MRPLVFAILAVITGLPCNANERLEVDHICRIYCKNELLLQSNLPRGSTIEASRKLFIERMLEVDDGELNAYFAKDTIEKNIRMYKNFLETRKSWMNADLTEEDIRRFQEKVRILERDQKMIESLYPTDLRVFERIKVMNQGEQAAPSNP